MAFCTGINYATDMLWNIELGSYVASERVDIYSW